mgnify:CR=1 FL=1
MRISLSPLVLTCAVLASTPAASEDVRGTLEMVAGLDNQNIHLIQRNIAIWPEVKAEYARIWPGKPFDPRQPFFSYARRTIGSTTLEISINHYGPGCDQPFEGSSTQRNWDWCNARIILTGSDDRPAAIQTRLCAVTTTPLVGNPALDVMNDPRNNHTAWIYKPETRSLAFATYQLGRPVPECTKELTTGNRGNL